MLLYRVKTGLTTNINYNLLLDDRNYDTIYTIEPYIPFDYPNKIFSLACAKGCRKIAEFIYDHHDINIRYDEDYALYYAFINGYHDIGLYVLNLYSRTVDEELINYIFCKCCEKGHLESVNYIYNNFDVDVNMVDDYALRWATLNKHYDVVTYLLSMSNFTEDGLLSTIKNAQISGDLHIIILIISFYPWLEEEFRKDVMGCFTDLCRSGRIDSCRWFYNQYMKKESVWSILKENVLSWNNLFIDMCYLGHIEVAKFILEIQPETDPKYFGYRSIIEACRGGKLEVAKWLVECFDDNNVMYSEVFNLSCLGGYSKLCRWVYSLPKFPKNRETIQLAFNNACRGGHLNLAKWLYSLEHMDLTENYCLIFRICCERGYIELVEWLYEEEPYMNIGLLNDYAFTAACKNNHIEVANFLTKHCKNYSFKVVKGKIKSWRLNHELEKAKELICVDYDKAIQVVGIKYKNKLTGGNPLCCICYDSKDRVVNTPCHHTYCFECMLNWFITNNLKRNFKCACCRKIFNWEECYDTLVYKDINDSVSITELSV